MCIMPQATQSKGPLKIEEIDNPSDLWVLLKSSRSPSQLGHRQAASLCNDLQEDRIRTLNQ